MRLIDADRLKEYIDAQKGRPFIGCTIGEALKIITDEQPTVDAVQVVRCKDCKWRDNQKGATEWMPCRVLITPNNFYCASGKRKDGGDGSTD